MKKGAIFDMDGTLFDTERLYRESWLYAAEAMGEVPHPDFPAAMCCASGMNAVNNLHRFYPNVELEEIANVCRKHLLELIKDHLPMKEGTKEILSYLKENGVKIAVASSSNHKMINSNITRSGIAAYFDVITSGQDVTNGKPAPDIFLLAAERLGLPPEDCYVFEDSISGVKAGVDSRAATVMIVDLTEPDEETSQSCVGVYHSFLEVIEAIKSEKL